jgi:hypothetical protein
VAATAARRPASAIVEFHSFATEALTSILAEARKYGLALVIAHQYLDQLTDEIRQSVFGNVGNLIAFRVGQSDARILEDELGGAVKMGNLVSLGKHEIYARLLDHGRAMEPFRGKTLPADTRHGNRQEQGRVSPGSATAGRGRRWKGRLRDGLLAEQPKSPSFRLPLQ